MAYLKFIWILIPTLILSISCGKNNSSKPQGGQDSGGGDTLGSTNKEIYTALKNKHQIFNELQELIFSIPLKFPPNTPINELKGFEEEWYFKFSSANIDLFNIVGNLIVKDDCYDKYGEQKTASVSNHEEDGGICISINKLSKVSSNSLYKEITLILIHEISHLIGYEEDGAVKMQNFMKEKYEETVITGNLVKSIKGVFTDVSILMLLELQLMIDKPDSYYINGEILKDEDFIQRYESVYEPLRGILTTLIFSYIDYLERRGGAYDVELKQELKSLTGYLSGGGINSLIRSHSGRNGKYHQKKFFEKQFAELGNYIFIKKYFQSTYSKIERILDRMNKGKEAASTNMELPAELFKNIDSIKAKQKQFELDPVP